MKYSIEVGFKYWAPGNWDRKDRKVKSIAPRDYSAGCWDLDGRLFNKFESNTKRAKISEFKKLPFVDLIIVWGPKQPFKTMYERKKGHWIKE